MTVKLALVSARPGRECGKGDGRCRAVAVAVVGEQRRWRCCRGCGGWRWWRRRREEGGGGEGAGGGEGGEHAVFQLDAITLGEGEIGDQIAIGGGVEGGIKAEGVGVKATGEGVVAGAADEGVVATPKDVIAIRAIEDVGGSVAGDEVVEGVAGAVDGAPPVRMRFSTLSVRV